MQDEKSRKPKDPAGANADVKGTRRGTGSIQGGACEHPKGAAKLTQKSETAETNSANLRKKDFVDRVVQRSGLKKKDVKPIVDAVLAELGAVLANGQDLNLPPLGRVHVNRQKAQQNGRIMIIKIRQRDGDASEGNEPDLEA